MSKILSSSTATEAGSDQRWSKWTLTRQKVVRLEELVKFYKSLRRLGLAPWQEQKIASKLTMRHLSGLSATYEISQRLNESDIKDICWRKAGDRESVTRAAFKSLIRGL